MSDGEGIDSGIKKFKSIQGGLSPDEPATIKNSEMIGAKDDVFDFVTDIVDTYKGDTKAAINSTKHRIPFETDDILRQIQLMREQPDEYSAELQYALSRTYLRRLAEEIGLEDTD